MCAAALGDVAPPPSAAWKRGCAAERGGAMSGAAVLLLMAKGLVDRPLVTLGLIGRMGDLSRIGVGLAVFLGAAAFVDRFHAGHGEGLLPD